MGIAEVGSGGGLDPLVWTNPRAARLDDPEAGVDPLIWTAARAARLDVPEAGLTSAIKSVQRGSSAVYSGVVIISIAAVNMSKSFIVASGYSSTADVRSNISTTTTIALQASSGAIVYWEVIEYV